MNKHYFLMAWEKVMGQRYMAGPIFSKTKVCLDSYFWRIAKIGPAAVFAAIIFSSAGCGGHQTAGEIPVPAPDGAAVFRRHCVICHGADGTLGLNGAKDLTQSALPLEERIEQITNGKNMMTPFRDVLPPEEIKAVAEYTMRLKK